MKTMEREARTGARALGVLGGAFLACAAVLGCGSSTGEDLETVAHVRGDAAAEAGDAAAVVSTDGALDAGPVGDASGIQDANAG